MSRKYVDGTKQTSKKKKVKTATIQEADDDSDGDGSDENAETKKAKVPTVKENFDQMCIRDKVNVVAMGALFVLTLILCKVIFIDGGAVGVISDDGLTFGAAVELSVAMPLSWLPLISDYTREAKSPVKATAASAVTYGVISCWMYVIGMGAAIYTGEYDLSLIHI